MSARRYHTMRQNQDMWGMITWTPWNEHLFGSILEIQSPSRPRHRVQGRFYRLLKRRQRACLKKWIQGWHRDRSKLRFDLAD